jgi:hypothetical protein
LEPLTSGQRSGGAAGNGQINAFDSDGEFVGALRDANGKPLVIDGLWTLILGGGRNSKARLHFCATPHRQRSGIRRKRHKGQPRCELNIAYAWGIFFTSQHLQMVQLCPGKGGLRTCRGAG